MLVHSFKVRATAGATQHVVSVKIPAFDDLTETQLHNAYRKAISSLTIDVQRGLRKQITKGLRGEALNAEAQRRFVAVIDAKRQPISASVVDGEGFSEEQVAYLRSRGIYVELPDDDGTDEDTDEVE